MSNIPFAKSKIFFPYLKVDNKNAYYLHMLKAQILINFNLKEEDWIQGLIMLGKNLPPLSYISGPFFFYSLWQRLNCLGWPWTCSPPARSPGLGNSSSNTEYLKRAHSFLYQKHYHCQFSNPVTDYYFC